MNERIKELVLQANPASKKIYESDNWEYNCAAWCAQDVEKFAELIVRECVEVCKSRVGNSDYNTGRMHCASDLKEHFGLNK